MLIQVKVLLVISLIFASLQSQCTPPSQHLQKAATYQGNLQVYNQQQGLKSHYYSCIGGGCKSSCISQEMCIQIGGEFQVDACYKYLIGQFVEGNRQLTGCPPPEQIQVDGACYYKCGNNAYILNGICICIPNYSYSYSANQCVPQNLQCGQNFVPVQGICLCPQNFQLNEYGQCIKSCPPQSKWNPQQLLCQCTEIGHVLIQNKCAACPANSDWDGNSCYCIQGYSLIDGNCVDCGSGNCETCSENQSLILAVKDEQIVKNCKPIPTGNKHTISLTQNLVDKKVVYQGVAMSLMPTAILTNGCDICNDLLLVNVATSFSNPTFITEYITNSQYWFLITFDFTGYPFIPNFQFTVQISPIYANYFSAVDMSQKLISAVNPKTLLPSPTSSSGGSPSTYQFSKKASNSQLATLFG